VVVALLLALPLVSASAPASAPAAFAAPGVAAPVGVRAPMDLPPGPPPGWTPPDTGHSTGYWLMLALVAAALTVMVALFALAVRRSSGRGSGAERDAGVRAARDTLATVTRAPDVPSQAPRRTAPRGAGPRTAAPSDSRPATVCTELHPQGYVDIDRCLYRAVWAAPGEPVPAPGAAVGVARPAAGSPDPEVLLAFPSKTPGRPHVQ